MKVALVVHDFDPGFGQGRYTVELARRLASRYDIHVLANSFAVAPEPNVTFQKIRARRKSAIATIVSFARGAEKTLRQGHFDLVHAQGLTCSRADVITAHICNAARYQHNRANGWKSKLFALVASSLERRFYQRSQPGRLLTVSHRVAEEIKKHYGWSQPGTVTYHGIDLGEFHPATEEERVRARAYYQLTSVSWVWLFMGEAAKGLRLVLDQFALSGCDVTGHFAIEVERV